MRFLSLDADLRILTHCSAARNLYSRGPSCLVPFTALAPSLLAAESTSRLIGKDREAERQRWQLVDIQIVEALQDHLSDLASSSSGDLLDSWTEAEAACELLRGMVPIVDESK